MRYKNLIIMFVLQPELRMVAEVQTCNDTKFRVPINGLSMLF